MNRKNSSALFVVLLLTMVLVTVVSAAVNWDEDSLNGPVWNDPFYDFTFDVVSISNPQNYICIDYAVNGGPPASSLCTCPACLGDTGTWTCQIPVAPDAEINYSIVGRPDANCNGSPDELTSGSFTTSITAVELSTFQTSDGPNRISTLILFGIVLLLIVPAGMIVWREHHKTETMIFE